MDSQRQEVSMRGEEVFASIRPPLDGEGSWGAVSLVCVGGLNQAV